MIRQSIFICTTSLLFFSCSSEAKKEGPQKPGGGNARPALRADGYIVQTKLLIDNIDIPGTIVANETTEVHPEVAARVGTFVVCLANGWKLGYRYSNEEFESIGCHGGTDPEEMLVPFIAARLD